MKDQKGKYKFLYVDMIAKDPALNGELTFVSKFKKILNSFRGYLYNEGKKFDDDFQEIETRLIDDEFADNFTKIVQQKLSLYNICQYINQALVELLRDVKFPKQEDCKFQIKQQIRDLDYIGMKVNEKLESIPIIDEKTELKRAIIDGDRFYNHYISAFFDRRDLLTLQIKTSEERRQITLLQNSTPLEIKKYIEAPIKKTYCSAVNCVVSKDKSIITGILLRGLSNSNSFQEPSKDQKRVINENLKKKLEERAKQCQDKFIVDKLKQVVEVREKQCYICFNKSQYVMDDENSAQIEGTNKNIVTVKYFGCQEHPGLILEQKEVCISYAAFKQENYDFKFDFQEAFYICNQDSRIWIAQDNKRLKLDLYDYWPFIANDQAEKKQIADYINEFFS